MRNILLLFSMTIIISSCSTSIYLVRHAEKETSSGSMMNKNPDLTYNGRLRAKALADTLTGKKIDAVYSTSYLRTIHTADPTAIIKMREVINYSDGNKLLDSLITQKHKSYLVVGHSNTIPPMLEHIGLHPTMHEIPDSDYDNLFVVKIRWSFGRSMKLEEKTYGKTSP